MARKSAGKDWFEEMDRDLLASKRPKVYPVDHFDSTASILSRKKRREARRKLNELNRANRKKSRAEEHAYRVKLDEERQMAKRKVQNARNNVDASFYKQGTYAPNLPKVVTKATTSTWIKEHSTTARRKKPLDVVPGYYTAIAACIRTSTPMRGTYRHNQGQWLLNGVLDNGIGDVNPFRAVGALAQVSGMGPGYYPITPIDLRSRVENTVLKQIQNRKLDLAVSLGEGRETMAFLKKSHQDVTRLTNYLLDNQGKHGKAFKRLVEAHPKSIPEARNMSVKAFNKLAPDNRWLEYNFALIPFVGDIQGAAEVIAEHYAPKLKLLYARSSGRETSMLDYLGIAGRIQDGWQIRYRGVMYWRFVSHVNYQVDNSTLKLMSELGFTNPGSYIYQRTPLSFVADWLLPVGDFIGLFDAPLGCSLVAAYSGCYMYSEITKQFERVYSAKSTDMDCPQVTETYRGYVRRNTNVFPYPSLYVKNPLSTWTALTSAALIKQRSK